MRNKNCFIAYQSCQERQNAKFEETKFIWNDNLQNLKKKTLPKALRTKVLTALTNNFGLVCLVQYT